MPLSITVQHGDADLLQVAKDILGLTKLNYNACQLGENLVDPRQVLRSQSATPSSSLIRNSPPLKTAGGTISSMVLAPAVSKSL